MKVAYIVSLFPKLSETFILRELIALRQRGHDPVIVSLKRETEPVVHPEAVPLRPLTWIPRMGVRFLSDALMTLVTRPLSVCAIVFDIALAHLGHPVLMAKTLALVPIAMHASRELMRRQVVHVHAHWASYPATVAWAVRRLTGIPYSVTGHAHDLFLPNPMLCRKVRESKFFATISEFNRALIVQACGPPAVSKVRLIRCGIPLGEFPYATERQGAGPVLSILSVGRLVDYKGLDVLILACARLIEAGRSIECRIIGEGPERPRLEALTEETGLAGVVHFEGSLPQGEVRRWFERSDLFVLPCVTGGDGQQDGIPIVLMEAMALGIPVISTRLSGIPELIKDGTTGLLAAPGDAEHLASVMERLVTDARLAARLRDAARHWIEREFDLDRSVTQLSDGFLEGTGAAG